MVLVVTFVVHRMLDQVSSNLYSPQSHIVAQTPTNSDTNWI